MKRKGDLLSTWSGRAFIAALALLIGLGMAGVGALLSSTYGAAQVAGNARQLHWTNATVGAAGITRAAIAQAVFFSFDDRSGDKATAIEEGRANLATLAEASGSAYASEILVNLIEELVAAGQETVDMAEIGNPADAETHRLTFVEPNFAMLKSELEANQGDLTARIADSESTGGTISRITFVAIAFLIPAIAMVVFWLLLRRRLREREAEMQAYIDAERELNRAKDDFLASLSHELRTPLTTIVGFSEILNEDPTVRGPAREHVHLISASSADLSRMVNDLLTAARLDADALSIQPEPVDLAEQVEAATAPYVRAGEDLQIRVPSIEVYADPLHARQVVDNLVSNALRHGGEHIQITGTSTNGHGVLVVADDGPGVPPELEERLFKRFFHKGRQGLVAGSVGLGLAISNELAQRMGGSLRYQRIDGWTSFSFHLPSVPTVDLGERQPILAGTQRKD